MNRKGGSVCRERGVNSSPCWSLPLAPSLFLLSTPAHIFQSYCNAGKYDDKLIEVFRRTVNFPSNLYPDVFVNVSRDKYLFIERFSYTFPASITKTFQQGRKNELFRGRRGGRRKKKKEIITRANVSYPSQLNFRPGFILVFMFPSSFHLFIVDLNIWRNAIEDLNHGFVWIEKLMF